MPFDASVNDRLIHDLMHPKAYPWAVDEVRLIETHVSWVFLTGARVLKIKRPVQFAFVDHRTPEARRESCEREVVLNRRLTNDVYLGVVPIRLGAEGRYHVDGPGEAREWGTLMRQLPADGMLDRLIEEDSAPPDFAGRLGDLLATFHREIAHPCVDDPGPAAAAQAAVVTDNVREIAPFAGPVLNPAQFDIVGAAMLAFAEQRRNSLEDRARAGWIRDGHGDLRAEHVCFEPDGSIQVYDCIDFNEQLRCLDVVSDIAFLLMDLRRLGEREVAERIVDRYRAAGISIPEAWRRFYETHRALVRVKVESLEASGTERDDPARHRRAAREYLDIAFESAIDVGPALFVMSGLSGTGKSTVARKIARATGSRWIRSDVIRRQLTESIDEREAWLSGAYDPSWTRRTYEQMFREGAEALRAGMPAILDATFLDQKYRERAAAVADELAAPCLLIETAAPEPVVRRRLEGRQRQQRDPSEATVEIYLRQRERLSANPVQVPAGVSYVRVETANDEAQWLTRFYLLLDERGIARPGLF
jgi:uncharacterized protein